MLYRQKKQQPRQLILPSKLKSLVYNRLDVNTGHIGTNRTPELIKSRFYWPLMDNEIKHFVTQICPCVKRKKSHIIKTVVMRSISTFKPLEIISMNFLHVVAPPCCNRTFHKVLLSLHHKELGRENCSREILR